MKTTNIKSESGKISLWEKLSYSGGDVASCITFGVVSSYLPIIIQISQEFPLQQWA